jgi:hypothetical protein
MFTKADAILDGDGRTFDEIAAARLTVGAIIDEATNVG